MRVVTWQDQTGRRHRSMVRDSDPDSAAPTGLSNDPPDVRALDWEAIQVDLHNALFDAGLFTWTDLQRGDVRGIILHAVHRRLQQLYREVPKHE